MVMREAKSVQRMPKAKLLGASMDFAEPHGHVGRQHRRCAILRRATNRRSAHVSSEKAMETPWLLAACLELRGIRRTAFSSSHGRSGLSVANDSGAFGIADQRAAWSCAKRNPFSECRRRSCGELPWISRSRMAMSAASIADAISAEIESPKRPCGFEEPESPLAAWTVI
jgi:hypothetical protein